MSKIAEQKALEAYPIAYFRNGGGIDDANASDRAVYEESYDQAMQDFMEKARTWLFSDLYRYLINSKEISIDEISRHFKNYMKNESEN